MAIAKGYKQNFETLRRACKNGDLALLETKDKSSGAIVYAVVACQHEDDGEITMVPLAKMFDGNPYDELSPPNPDGGFFE